jgi:uracil DNA glycosylase/uncharacterized protein YegL
MSTTLYVSPALSLVALPAGATAVADLLLTLRTESASGPGFGARLPLEVSIVLDRSGSMSGKPLEKALAATEVLLDALGPDDTVSVVVFDDKVATVIEPARLIDAAAAKKVLKKVRPGGATALHAGWVKGCEHVAGRPNERVVRRVLLLTDGQANHGLTDPKKIIEQARTQGAERVSTTTLGFGSAFNEDLLIGMAEASGGNFYYIETPEEATQVFAIEGEALTSIAAERVTLTLTPKAEGVRIVDVLNRLPSRELAGGGVEVWVGEMYHAEDKLIAVRLEIDAGAELAKGVPLVDVRFTYEPVPAKRGEVREGAVTVLGAMAKEKVLADPDTLRKVARIRVARTKERAVELSDAGKHADAAGVFRELAGEIHERGLDDEFDMAEELAQIEHFAAALGKAPLRGDDRKILRDQSYQGRTRSRSDLMARGGGGGSASSLPEVTSAGPGVELLCVREGGKLRIKVLTPGYEEDLPILVPRGVREEGVRYVADKLVLSSNSTFYRAEGQIRRLKGGMAAAVLAESGGDRGDPMKLTELFAGGGEPWVSVLKPVIEAQPSAPMFIGPGRDKSVVPVRELTFQALKPNPPHRWKVVAFGQNPYPRVESATGIAMFDNAFGKWTDSQFGKTVSMRCIIKAGAMWKYKAQKATPIADLRKLLADKKVVQPPEWFQAMLTQGVLLLNASLTASSDGSMSTDQHAAFWRPAVEALVEEILRSKQGAAEADRGVVFAWWGAHARSLRSLVERLAKKYPAVKVKHVDHCNPAAQGDAFCDGDHFAAVNAALRSVKATEIDWLPSVGWNASAAASGAERMGDFISKTMDLHKMYLERLQEVAAEVREVLPAIMGVGETPLMPFADAVKPLAGSIVGIEHYFKRSQQYAEAQAAQASAGALGAVSGVAPSLDEIAAIYLYTTESPFYRKLNAALRAPDRGEATPWFGYLRLLLGAMTRLQTYAGSLFRGVAADLRKHYPKGETITWWGVSSCTAKRSVATSFLGTKGKRTLFEVRATRAVSIRRYSAFTGEDEYLLAPGTQLIVSDVKAEKDGLCTVTLTESPATPLVT